MTQPTVRYFVKNRQNQPLELYLKSGHRVLGPQGEANVPEADLHSPQLAALREDRLVTIREGVGVPEETEAVESTPEVAVDTPAGKARKTQKKEG